MTRLEGNQRLDVPVGLLRPLADRLVPDEERAYALQGQWFGHGVHPMLTDFPLGAWMSASLLDLVGGTGSRDAATTLVGFGVLAAIPATVTGLAEWGSLRQHEQQRVGVVHAGCNIFALAFYSCSYVARRRHRHSSAAWLGIAGGLAAVAGGYLGGHLTQVRKVSSRHPAFGRASE